MTIEQSKLEEKLKAKLEPDHIAFEDISDQCGYKFNLVIVSKAFEGKPLLQRHRMIHAALEEEMKIIHALSMKTLTPEQWAKQQGNS